MTEHNDQPEVDEFTRRWSEALAQAYGVTLPEGQRRHIVEEIARQARDQVEQSRAAALERFARLYVAAPCGIALTDPHGTIVEANEALGSLLGAESASLRGTAIAELAASSCEASTLRDNLHKLQDDPGGHQQLQIDLAYTTNEKRRTVTTLSTLPADVAGKEYPIVLVQDVSEQHMLGETLRHQNVHDWLTGLPNATQFDHQIEISLADTTHPQIALVLLDLDGFRVINDGLGAEVGDQLLRSVANKLRESFSAHDAVLARLTGDGFGVLLRGELTTTAVIKLVEHVLGEISEPVYIGGNPVGVNASAGIVVQETATDQAPNVKRKAEITLHRAKEQGRSKWMLFDSEADARDRHRYRLGASIAGALENGEFELLYQPTVRLDGSGSLPVVNTVLRWHHPESGPLAAEEFIPIADAIGMTLPIGRWMLGEALATHARWRSASGGPVPDLCLRLPGRLAIDDDLVSFITSELERNDVDPSSLRLCASAATVLDPRGEVPDSFGVLRELGVQLVLEASAATDLELIHKHDLPVGYVVLSGSLIENLCHPQAASSTVRHLEHLITTARDLGLRTGAEGVRTNEQANTLGELGVVAARGEFFLEAAPAEQIEPLITEQARQAPAEQNI